MKFADVSETFAFSPQLEPSDMQQIADAGFGTMICNRPDGEEPGQPTVSSVRDAAEAAGIAFHHIPVSGGEFPEVAIKASAKVREEAAGKVDRKSVVWGKGGYVRVGLGGGRNIEKK